MTTKVLKHKGYQGSIENNLDTDRLEGRVLHIRSLITYAGDTIPDLKASFRQEVDEYLSDCEELGVEPEKPYSGTFQIRCDADVQRRLAHKAAEAGVSFNQHVSDVLKNAVEQTRSDNNQFSRVDMARLTHQLEATYSVLTRKHSVHAVREEAVRRIRSSVVRVGHPLDVETLSHPRNVEDENIEFSS